MILSKTNKTIIINAGHYDLDPGKVVKSNNISFSEEKEVLKIRDFIKELAPKMKDFTFHFVPDNLSLTKSIQFANKITSKIDGGFAIDIHLNANNRSTVQGTEAYYGTSDTSKKIATVMSRNVASALKLKNRGCKPDTETFVGSLGWIRQTKMWASLVEVCFMTNAFDLEVLLNNGHRKAAIGILNGICELYNVSVPEWDKVPEVPKPTPQPEPKPTPEPLRVPQQESTWLSIISIIKNIFKKK